MPVDKDQKREYIKDVSSEQQILVHTKKERNNMSVTDGFNKADSIGQMPGNVLIGEKSCGGVTVKVYMQECQGLAENGEHGWFHVGIDLVVDATGEILDSLPITLADSDPAHEGHYKGEEAARACAAAYLAEYQSAFDKGTAAYEAEGRTPDLEAWAQGFRDIRRTREEMDAFYNLMTAMLLGDDDEDAGDSSDMLMSLLASALGIDPLDDDEEAGLAALLGDFDPDKVEPTDEGYSD